MRNCLLGYNGRGPISLGKIHNIIGCVADTWGATNNDTYILRNQCPMPAWCLAGDRYMCLCREDSVTLAHCRKSNKRPHEGSEWNLGLNSNVQVIEVR